MSEWVAAVDPDSGATYYTNTITFESSWTPPEGFVDPNAQMATTEALEAPAVDEHPGAWEEKIDESSGAVYYLNSVTGASQWEQPAGFTRPVVENPDDVASNWSMQTDPASQSVYYINSVTGNSQWVIPECMLAAELSSMGVVEPPAPVRRSSAVGIQLPNISGPRRKSRADSPLVKPVVVEEAPAPDAAPAAPAEPVRSPPPPPPVVVAPPPPPPPKAPVAVAVAAPVAKPAAAEEAPKQAAAEAEARGSLAEGKSGGEFTLDPALAENFVLMDYIKDDESSTAELIKLSEGHSMEDYGAKYFNLDRKGIFGKKSTIEKVLGWKDELIKTSLKSLTPELTAQAIQLYRNVTGFMGDRSSGKPPLEHATKILKNMMMAPEELRDEVFCQVIKQTRGNPSPENEEKGWALLLLCLTSFAPSQSLMLPMMSHCATALNNPRKQIAQLSTMCLHYIPKMCKFGFRRETPSRMELEAVSRADVCSIKVQFVDEKYVQVPVTSWTTVSELSKILCKRIGIQSSRSNCYGVFESNKRDEERPLDPDERVLELVSGWERIYTEAADESSSNKQASEKVDLGDKTDRNQFYFLFKLVMFIDGAGESTADPIDVELEYVQAVKDVVLAKYPFSEQDALTLAALQMQEKHGDHPEGFASDFIQNRLRAFVASKFYEGNEAKHRELENTVMTLYSKLKGYTQTEARLSYLDYVRGWKIYGSTFYVSEPLNNKELPAHVVLAVNNKGILVIDASNKEYVAEYGYPNIVTWGNSANSFVVITGTPTRQNKLYFKTIHGKEINALLRGYVETRNAAKKRAEK
jgi:hypothetical protein